MDSIPVGVLGCGTISDAYFDADDRFDAFDVVACADLDADAAREKADEYGLRACDPDELVEDDEVELVVNLTPPGAHLQTCRQFLDAGTHVYVEKPLATTAADARAVVETAEREGVRIGAAPDTLLGAGLQTCRSLVDDGAIGDPIGATAVWVGGGHENWHPNPDFYYHEGGGPLFDMGPYYVTALVFLLGAAERVAGSVSRTHEERVITSEPRHGERIDVEVPTHESGVVDFANGATATVTTSFDAPGGSNLSDPAFELYGTDGTLSLPNPNHFEGPVEIREPGSDGVEEVSLRHEYTAGRGAGVADMAAAIRGDWEHRTSGALAEHVLDILEGVRSSSESGEHVAVDSTVERPAPLPTDFPAGL